MGRHEQVSQISISSLSLIIVMRKRVVVVLQVVFMRRFTLVKMNVAETVIYFRTVMT